MSKAALKEFFYNSSLFTISIFRNLLEGRRDNFVASPFTAEIILTLVLLGAKGETYLELRDALQYPNEHSYVKFAIKTHLPNIIRNKNYTVQLTNKIYVDEDIVIKPEFVNLAKQIFQIQSENLDFEKANLVVDAINEWVSAQTGNAIADIITPSRITPNLKMILVSAMTFLGPWVIPFDASQTLKAVFYKRPDNEVEVDMMSVCGKFGFYLCEELDAKFLKMEIANGAAYIIIGLPNEIDGIDVIETHIANIFCTEYKVKEVNVMLPKFKLDILTDYISVLRSLGVYALFSREADLNGVGPKGLNVGQILQKVCIEVNEFGFGVTSPQQTKSKQTVDVVLFTGKSKKSTDNKETFKADHPFLFYVKTQDIILFAGKIICPKT